MLALKRNAVIGLNLYCGGGPTLPPSPPGSPSGAGTPPTPGARDPGPPAEGVRPATLIGGASWGSNGPSEGARALIGSAAAAPALGAGGPRPGPLWRPEEELDGCDPEAERMGPAAAAAHADGSLPSTPPAEDDDEERDGLYQDSLELISRYLREAAELGAPGGKQLLKRLLSGPRGAGPAALEKALETLRRVGDGVMEKHQLAFQGMLRKLDIKNEEDLKSVTAVATHVFSDGVTNWGRIVTLISFGAFVAKHLKSINQENCINTLAGIITDVLVTGKRDWLVNQRGWEGFVEFFRVEDLEGSIRNVLVAFAGFAGLGASLAYMMR
ncbi:induced myeloid leukemia cell differentiation protein Mcl-1 [Malaclemys terrapin pileata]|uniref:induced myeloid leukemia cell differentiation protein Mcl-1 n=1 Tax=Malaclemys terrapin pileata TaxID=2991368 RepID=UPI0023A897AE|nr:induced myeloid leukemia cell differentiation protein Mcl-1 [Malaclemys terrapin pileata]